jgi:hypothetical protein
MGLERKRREYNKCRNKDIKEKKRKKTKYRKQR